MSHTLSKCDLFEAQRRYLWPKQTIVNEVVIKNLIVCGNNDSYRLCNDLEVYCRLLMSNEQSTIIPRNVHVI